MFEDFDTFNEFVCSLEKHLFSIYDDIVSYDRDVKALIKKVRKLKKEVDNA